MQTHARPVVSVAAVPPPATPPTPQFEISVTGPPQVNPAGMLELPACASRRTTVAATAKASERTATGRPSGRRSCRRSVPSFIPLPSDPAIPQWPPPIYALLVTKGQERDNRER